MKFPFFESQEFSPKHNSCKYVPLAHYHVLEGIRRSHPIKERKLIETVFTELDSS